MFSRLLFVLFLLAIVLSVLPRLTSSVYPFGTGIFKLFLTNGLKLLVFKFVICFILDKRRSRWCRYISKQCWYCNGEEVSKLLWWHDAENHGSQYNGTFLGNIIKFYKSYFPLRQTKWFSFMKSSMEITSKLMLGQILNILFGIEISSDFFTRFKYLQIMKNYTQTRLSFPLLLSAQCQMPLFLS